MGEIKSEEVGIPQRSVVDDIDLTIRRLQRALDLLADDMGKKENMTQEKNLKANIEHFSLLHRIAVQKYELYKYNRMIK